MSFRCLKRYLIINVTFDFGNQTGNKILIYVIKLLYIIHSTETKRLTNSFAIFAVKKILM